IDRLPCDDIVIGNKRLLFGRIMLESIFIIPCDSIVLPGPIICAYPRGTAWVLPVLARTTLTLLGKDVVKALTGNAVTCSFCVPPLYVLTNTKQDTASRTETVLLLCALALLTP